MLCKAQCSNPATSSCKITKCCTYNDRVFITACKSPDHSRTEVKSIVDVLLCPFERLIAPLKKTKIEKILHPSNP